MKPDSPLGEVTYANFETLMCIANRGNQSIASIHSKDVSQIEIKFTEGCYEWVSGEERSSVSCDKRVIDAFNSTKCSTDAVGVIVCESRSVELFAENIHCGAPACLVEAQTVDPSWWVEL
jgi:hypothetical protein